MTKIFLPIFIFFLHLGYFGPLLLGILDSSFLFVPFGNDILVVLLIASHHNGFPWYVLTAATGSTIGVFFLDLVTRNLGEAGIEKFAGKKRFESLKKRIGSRAGKAVVVASLIPPPFPFTLVIGTVSALQYSRVRLLIFNWIGRVIRFSIVGILAVTFGRMVIRVAESDEFKYAMYAFVFICIAGSVYSIVKWVRHSKSGKEKS